MSWTFCRYEIFNDDTLNVAERNSECVDEHGRRVMWRVSLLSALAGWDPPHAHQETGQTAESLHADAQHLWEHQPHPTADPAGAQRCQQGAHAHTHAHSQVRHVSWPLPCSAQVGVPVKFNGASSVQVRTPANLADLASYTSLKLYITLPEAARARRQDDATKQFIFYLGNKDVSITTATNKPIFCIYLSCFIVEASLSPGKKPFWLLVVHHDLRGVCSPVRSSWGWRWRARGCAGTSTSEEKRPRRWCPKTSSLTEISTALCWRGNTRAHSYVIPSTTNSVWFLKRVVQQASVGEQ